MKIDVQEQCRLLHEYDRETGYFPNDFDHDFASIRSKRLASSIEDIFGAACVEISPEHIQDCCYHAELILPRKITRTEWQPSIRICNYGEMATITDESALAVGILDGVISILTAHNLKYINECVLDESYSGMHQEIKTWRQRYFDFI